MARSTLSFYKLVGATIESVMSDGSCEEITLVDTKGVKYRIGYDDVSGLNVTKKSPRKSRAKKASDTSNDVTEEISALERAAKSGREDIKLYSDVRTATYVEQLEDVQLVPVHQTIEEFQIPVHYHDEEYVLEHEHYSQSDIMKKVRHIVSEITGLRQEDINWDSPYKWDLRYSQSLNWDSPNDLGCDSLDVVELLMAIEDEFKIEIVDEEIEKFPNLTFGQSVYLLYAKLNSHLYV